MFAAAARAPTGFLWHGVGEDYLHNVMGETADHDDRPFLEGVIGWVRGERFVLDQGQIVLGRSRHCDISMRRCAGYLRQPGGERDKDHDFNTVSRRHAMVTVEGSVVTIEDLSTNGTFCDEVLLTEPKSFDLKHGPVLLRLGTRESFRLQLGQHTFSHSTKGTGVSGEQESHDTHLIESPATEHVKPEAFGDAGKTLKEDSATPPPKGQGEQ